MKDDIKQKREFNEVSTEPFKSDLLLGETLELDTRPPASVNTTTPTVSLIKPTT